MLGTLARSGTPPSLMVLISIHSVAAFTAFKLPQRPIVPPITNRLECAASMAAFPSAAALGIEGQRCVIIFYAYDGIPIAERLLEAFEDEAKEFNACGCAMVAMRRGEMDAGDARKAREYAAQFPSINFVGGLERDEYAAVRSALGVGSNWFSESFRSLYNNPVATLLDPDGDMRTVLSHKGLSAANVLGNVMRELHAAVPPADGAAISLAEVTAQPNARAQQLLCEPRTQAGRLALLTALVGSTLTVAIERSRPRPTGRPCTTRTCSGPRCSRRTSRCASRRASGST